VVRPAATTGQPGGHARLTVGAVERGVISRINSTRSTSANSASVGVAAWRTRQSLNRGYLPQNPPTPLTDQRWWGRERSAAGTHRGSCWFIAHPARGSTANLSDARAGRLRTWGLAIGLRASSAFSGASRLSGV